ncbi:hypothetical protein PB2503_10749 [Parvularcula bermudensis HTCC2503]|uniref:Serine aminopeptidase S33 domain-containing protein n=1 Tax=Parvularcula bermudensis (strain ATCC BAA-594 / HTCC2503 / KCTC 12087) TaxID=314260 RepID=E0THB1_PARBH|nr:alpha/beta hydrolase [Parvularcula bermudensis]ADM10201.1 hypothetical protein PB2503_10749 [Parvularcula bermudensis HTCC2503]
MTEEELIFFGPEEGLVGTLTSPGGPSKGRIVIPNAGIVGRAGPHRLHTRLARSLADEGYDVLRIDLHGLGDSAPPPGDLGHEAQAVADIKAAIDALGSGRGRIILMGLCSGADNAQATALIDDRVTDLILLDPHAFAHPRRVALTLMQKAASPARWAALISRAAQRQANTASPAPSDRPVPDRRDFADQWQALARRGVGIYARYTNHVSHIVASAEEARLGLGLPKDRQDPRLCIEMDKDANHTYTDLKAQGRLDLAIKSWLRASGGAA